MANIKIWLNFLARTEHSLYYSLANIGEKLQCSDYEEGSGNGLPRFRVWLKFSQVLKYFPAGYLISLYLDFLISKIEIITVPIL